MASKSDKGKSKEVEDSSLEASHGATLFISNLPYTATSVDLQTLFSDIAPVRSAFVVTEQGTGVSKGVGYVAFALKEDAESCYKQITEEGLNLAGRPMRAQWADKKIRVKERGETGEKKQPKSRPTQPAKAVAKGPHDPLAIKTVIVSGLPSGIDSSTLWKKIRKAYGAQTLIWPFKKDSDEDETIAHVVFDTPSNAEAAVHKLHAHVYKGSLLSATLKKRFENLAKPKTAKTGAAAKTTAPSRASRLIVRNLPFNASEQDLRVLFLPHGPIHSIDIPKFEEERDGKTVSRNKGFAFVWYLSKKDAEKAMEKCNGQKVRAGMAEELVSDKQKKKKQRRLEKKMAAKQEGDAAAEGKADEPMDEDSEKEDEEEDEDKAKASSERVIAVDWALSKEKWKEEVAKAEEEQEDVEMSSASGSDSESESESEDEDGLGVHHGDSDASSWDSEVDGERDDEEPVKPQLPPPEAGTTLFVRNVPYEATEDDLRTLFRAFGPLRYARITMDHETGRSRGTGFACFWNKEDADKVIEQSDILRAETTGNAAAPKKNPFSLPSILTPDPSSSLARSLVLHGRTLDVVRAVTRDVAGKLKEEGEKLREKQDKRNVYLVREGVIFPNSPEASTIPPGELERRNASYNSRKALLKSNPSLFISRTRLSVRQLPLFVTERMLKRLGVHAVRVFEAEVKAGTRKPLTNDELVERTEETLQTIIREGVAEQEGTEVKKAPKGKGKGRETGVKQSKIVRVAERVDVVTGKGRSKGYGFLEMHHHADALRVLRWANNNKAVGALFEEWWQDELKDILKREKAKPKGEVDEDRVKRIEQEIDSKEAAAARRKEGRERLIVEFSIENVLVVQKRSGARQPGKEQESKGKGKDSDKKSRDDRSGKKRPAKDNDSDEDEPPKKKSNKGKEAKESKPPSKAEKTKKPFNPLGSVIGRKRKARKIRS